MLHTELDVWKQSIEFVTDIYEVTKKFPKEEMYGITSQIRRAAVSIPTNIAEGFSRKGKPELIQFLYISLGSVSELETLILISENLKYLNGNAMHSDKLKSIKKMLIKLIESVKKSNTKE